MELDFYWISCIIRAMGKKKLLCWCVCCFILGTGVSGVSTTKAAEVEYFLGIPGVKGTVPGPPFSGWVQANSFYYRLPGIPSPGMLLKSAPGKIRGMVMAKELEKPVCSFSKLQDSADDALNKALKGKQRFGQWELNMCTPGGKPFMTFLFKGVVISGISKRGNKQYVTFSFQRVVWSYRSVNIKDKS